jgi:hypothetical protein
LNLSEAVGILSLMGALIGTIVIVIIITSRMDNRERVHICICVNTYIYM